MNQFSEIENLETVDGGFNVYYCLHRHLYCLTISDLHNNYIYWFTNIEDLDVTNIETITNSTSLLNLHRDDGPAFQYKSKRSMKVFYYQNGLMHKLDGPASIEFFHNNKGMYHEYFAFGIKFTQWPCILSWTRYKQIPFGMFNNEALDFVQQYFNEPNVYVDGYTVKETKDGVEYHYTWQDREWKLYKIVHLDRRHRKITKTDGRNSVHYSFNIESKTTIDLNLKSKKQLLITKIRHGKYFGTIVNIKDDRGATEKLKIKLNNHNWMYVSLGYLKFGDSIKTTTLYFNKEVMLDSQWMFDQIVKFFMEQLRYATFVKRVHQGLLIPGFMTNVVSWPDYYCETVAGKTDYKWMYEGKDITLHIKDVCKTMNVKPVPSMWKKEHLVTLNLGII